MHEPIETRTSPTRRAAARILLFVGATALFLLLTPLSARADDGSSGLGGLVDAVTGNVDEVTESVTGAVEDATDAVTGPVEDMLDTVTETVEDTVETVTGAVEDVVETVEPVADDATGTIDGAIDGVDPGPRTAPPPSVGDAPTAVPDAVGRPTPNPQDVTAKRPPVGVAPSLESTLALATEAPAPDAGTAAPRLPNREPLVPAGAGGASAPERADAPGGLRVSYGQDLAVIAASLLIALVLVRSTRREAGLPATPAYRLLPERPG